MSYENMKSNRLVTISSVVMNVLNDMNIYSLENYQRFMQFALRGVKKLHLFHMDAPEVIYTTIPESGIVVLPDDFITYYKIGIRRNGQVWTLTHNKNLLIPRGSDCGEDIAEEAFDDVQEAVNSSYLYAPHWYNGVYMDTLYGATGGLNDGYFRIDKERNHLIISGLTTGTELVIEYKSTGIGRDGYISVEAEEALIAWVHWKHKQHNATEKFTFNQIANAKQDYLEEVEELRTLQYQFTVEQFLDNLYENYSQSIKR